MLDRQTNTNKTSLKSRLFFDWHVVSILVLVFLVFLVMAPWIAPVPETVAQVL